MSAEKSYKIFSGVIYTIFITLVGVYVGHYHPGMLGMSDPSETTPVSDSGESNSDISTLVCADSEDPALAHGVDMSLFWEVWDLAAEKHVDRGQDTQKLVDGAINGMLQYGYDDAFSWYVPPSENEILSEDMTGSFSGVGISLELISGELYIVAPLQGTPGEAAGLLAGDVITHVDGTDIADYTITESVSLIRGEIGTEVVLTIDRYTENGVESLEIAVVRDEIDPKSVTYEKLEDGLYLVSIREFVGDTVTEWDEAVAEIKADGVDGIVLDLRNNSGGYVSAAIHIISDFVPKGVAIYDDYGDGYITETEVSGYGNLYDVPVVILTNYGTASASEMLAGALQDYDLAQLVGTQTFGKGVIQELFNLDVEGENEPGNVRIVTSKWYTPKERWIQYEGLTPDIEVKDSIEALQNGEDPQQDTAIETLKEMLTDL
jgi:carboxyl-terminal processing protease